MVDDEKPDPTSISDAVTLREGILSHRVLSPYQRGETNIHLLLPEGMDATARYKTLYVLPVEPLDGCGWGDALQEFLEHGLPTKHGLICVMPTFSDAPWYADHPTDSQIRQESHLLKVVVPFVDATYPTNGERLLLGFSKSGWGAYSLLLRNPGTFAKAAAWDAPLGQASPTKYGMATVFPAQESLDPYNIWDLLKARAELLTSETRLALLGYGDFRGHHQATHYHMMKLGILHEYEDGPRREHHWQSGWVPGAVEFLSDV